SIAAAAGATRSRCRRCGAARLAGRGRILARQRIASFAGAADARRAGTSVVIARRRWRLLSKRPAHAVMNYRHDFHAGNFADVIKHIVLVRILIHLQEKNAAFRVVDTHAGAGIYDLTGEEAKRSGEWLTGIARVMQSRFSESAL